MRKVLKYLPVLLLFVVLFTPLVFHGQAAQHGATIKWTFTQGSDPAVGFFVLRGTVSGGPYTALNSTALPLTTLTYFDSTGVGGTTYFYVVTSVDAAGIQSNDSPQVSGTAISGTPPVPAGVTLTEQ
jgi:chitinase